MKARELHELSLILLWEFIMEALLGEIRPNRRSVPVIDISSVDKLMYGSALEVICDCRNILDCASAYRPYGTWLIMTCKFNFSANSAKTSRYFFKQLYYAYDSTAERMQM